MSASPPSPADETRSPGLVPANSTSTGQSSPSGGTTVGAPLPSKEELEREQLRLTNEKLKIETNKLQQDAKPERWWSRLFKNAIAFGGVVTVAATTYGVWESYDKTIVDRERTRLADQRTRFEDAIKRLESSSTISKLVGVSVLSGYLDASNKEAHRQVLFALAGLIATEKDPQTQAAVIDLLTSIPKDGPIALTDWRYFLDILVTQSRALVAKGDLSHHRHFQSVSLLTDDERAARTVGKLIASNVRKGVASDYPSYRGIYCNECDFHGVAFPHGVDFTGAILDGSNFSGARLEAAVFDNAELAGTKFVEADLRQAKFRSLGEPLELTRAGYLDHIASTLDINATVDIRMPNFSCANLADANFDYHSLFPGVIALTRSYAMSDQGKSGWYQNVPDYFKDQAQTKPKADVPVAEISPPKFWKANITGAHLETATFFTFTDPNYPGYLAFGSSMKIQNISFDQGIAAARVFEPTRRGETPLEVSIFQQRLRSTFYSVELDHASLPAYVADFLKGSPRIVPISPGTGEDPDLKCTPRRS